MSSNSIRISNQLFRDAQETGEYVARSAAQQVEFWARIGQALENSGVRSQLLLELLRGDHGTQAMARIEDDLRAAKRIEQARDIEAIKSGASQPSESIWFTEERAKNARALDSPY
ncbi:hypothetical protein FUT87_11520 [Mitsuaria sp. TWR114]|jgi:hypothetical protein|uniref:TA system antitoxin ParD family protein n=1 Tax=unclassified Roseateles TaxID=2626991 RepID=UPI0008E3E0F8|nr:MULTISPECIES: hypothetical protein [unclassified Roseateles]MBB3282545.1 hypothetical protein [Mitsuaria sp. BK037]TXD89026.1 hypothetical protein FUT87_11520 [Mitsuaria sp. TWR114]SFR86334.1 ParD-like antitoxin of type II toxin-antitoxin system [Mitsuaria sp. PDC51]